MPCSSETAENTLGAALQKNIARDQRHLDKPGHVRSGMPLVLPFAELQPG